MTTTTTTKTINTTNDTPTRPKATMAATGNSCIDDGVIADDIVSDEDVEIVSVVDVVDIGKVADNVVGLSNGGSVCVLGF